MNTVITPNHIDEEHLLEVMATMQEMGCPTIHVIDLLETQGVYVALEGSHRLAAAEKMGIAVNIIVVECSDDEIEEITGGDDAVEGTVSEYVEFIGRYINRQNTVEVETIEA